MDEDSIESGEVFYLVHLVESSILRQGQQSWVNNRVDFNSILSYPLYFIGQKRRRGICTPQTRVTDWYRWLKRWKYLKSLLETTLLHGQRPCRVEIRIFAG